MPMIPPPMMRALRGGAWGGLSPADTWERGLVVTSTNTRLRTETNSILNSNSSHAFILLSFLNYSSTVKYKYYLRYSVIQKFTFNPPRWADIRLPTEAKSILFTTNYKKNKLRSDSPPLPLASLFFVKTGISPELRSLK